MCLSSFDRKLILPLLLHPLDPASDVSVLADGSIPLQIKLQTCDAIDDLHVSYGNQPAWKRYSGYLLILLLLLVLASTLAAYLQPESRLSFKLRFFDAALNTRKLGYDVLDPGSQRLVFVAGLRTLYMLIVSYAHVVFVSGIASKETHSKCNIRVPVIAWK